MNEPKNFRAIMLSSTFADLKGHRERVIKAIREFGYKAEVMEDSGVRADADIIDSSLKMVRDSVAFALIISRKYGQIPISPTRNPDRLSITELEFNEAVRLKRPILLFIMGEKHPIIEEDIELDPDKRQKLEAFRERAKRLRAGKKVQRVYETFESLEQFTTAATIVVGKLAQYLEQSIALKKVKDGQTAFSTLSNITNPVPLHFFGRDADLAALDDALNSSNVGSPVALIGLGGVGKTTLAAAYAELRGSNYRATWRIAAETEASIRDGIFSLGAALRWISEVEKEDAVAAVMARLREEGEDILLIFDDVTDPDLIMPYIQSTGSAHVIVTTRNVLGLDVAARFKIDAWPRDVGADYLVAETGRDGERDAALALSQALGGLPVVHKLAAADVNLRKTSLAEYLNRFERERKAGRGWDLSENLLSPPRDPLPDAGPATRFAFVDGKLDFVPSAAWRNREGQAATYHSRARSLVQYLADRLELTDAVPDLAVSVSTLLDTLGENIDGVQPDQLRLASRSISAKARTYGHPAAQWEISPDSVSAFFELNDVLVDLQSFALSEIEAHEVAIRKLNLTPTIAAETKIALDLFTEGIRSSAEIVEERVELAFENAALLSDSAIDQHVKIQIEGDRALLVENVALAVARELGREVKEPSNETTDALATTVRKHLPRKPLGGRTPGASPNEPDGRPKRPRRTKSSGAQSNEISWESFTERVIARVNTKGPEAVGDALIQAATSLIKKPRSTIAGLGAAIVFLSVNAPILATGALATTVAWIAYELRRRHNQSK